MILPILADQIGRQIFPFQIFRRLFRLLRSIVKNQVISRGRLCILLFRRFRQVRRYELRIKRAVPSGRLFMRNGRTYSTGNTYIPSLSTVFGIGRRQRNSFNVTSDFRAVSRNIARPSLITILRRGIQISRPMTRMFILQSRHGLQLTLCTLPFVLTCVNLYTMSFNRHINHTGIIMIRINIRRGFSVFKVRSNFPSQVSRRVVRFEMTYVSRSRTYTNVSRVKACYLITSMMGVSNGSREFCVGIVQMAVLRFVPTLRSNLPGMVVFVTHTEVMVTRTFPSFYFSFTTILLLVDPLKVVMSLLVYRRKPLLTTSGNRTTIRTRVNRLSRNLTNLYDKIKASSRIKNIRRQVVKLKQLITRRINTDANGNTYPRYYTRINFVRSTTTTTISGRDNLFRNDRLNYASRITNLINRKRVSNSSINRLRRLLMVNMVLDARDLSLILARRKIMANRLRARTLASLYNLTTGNARASSARNLTFRLRNLINATSLPITLLNLRLALVRILKRNGRRDRNVFYRTTIINAQNSRRKSTRFDNFLRIRKIMTRANATGSLRFKAILGNVNVTLYSTSSRNINVLRIIWMIVKIQVVFYGSLSLAINIDLRLFSTFQTSQLHRGGFRDISPSNPIFSRTYNMYSKVRRTRLITNTNAHRYVTYTVIRTSASSKRTRDSVRALRNLPELLLTIVRGTSDLGKSITLVIMRSRRSVMPTTSNLARCAIQKTKTSDVGTLNLNNVSNKLSLLSFLPTRRSILATIKVRANRDRLQVLGTRVLTSLIDSLSGFRRTNLLRPITYFPRQRVNKGISRARVIIDRRRNMFLNSNMLNVSLDITKMIITYRVSNFLTRNINRDNLSLFLRDRISSLSRVLRNYLTTRDTKTCIGNLQILLYRHVKSLIFKRSTRVSRVGNTMLVTTLYKTFRRVRLRISTISLLKRNRYVFRTETVPRRRQLTNLMSLQVIRHLRNSLQSVTGKITREGAGSEALRPYSLLFSSRTVPFTLFSSDALHETSIPSSLE